MKGILRSAIKGNSVKKKDQEQENAALQLRISHVGLGFLGNHFESATVRIEQGGYYSPRSTREGLMYVLRRGEKTIPIELKDTGVAPRGGNPDIGWDYSSKHKCFMIKTSNPQLQGEVLVKLFGFKQVGDSFNFGGLKIRLVEDSIPAKWHTALYHQKGKEARMGFFWLCSKHTSSAGDAFAKISDAFMGVSQELPSTGLFSFEVPGLPGFSIEILFGSTSLRLHALESKAQDKIGDRGGWGWAKH